VCPGRPPIEFDVFTIKQLDPDATGQAIWIIGGDGREKGQGKGSPLLLSPLPSPFSCYAPSMGQTTLLAYEAQFVRRLSQTTGLSELVIVQRGFQLERPSAVILHM